jgi:predicted nucleic acid-binding protein
VKRVRPLPLLASFCPEVFNIDSSAWVDIEKRTDAEDVWTMVAGLIEQGRIVACAPVLAELRNDPMYSKRLKPYERALQVGDRDSDDVDYLQHVGKITHAHPAMSKARGTKTPADPYIVALAELDNYTVVTSKTMRKRPNRKISGICAQRGIKCLSLSEFVSAIKKEMKVQLETK